MSLTMDACCYDSQNRVAWSRDLRNASVGLPDHSQWQATTGVSCGGLGLRTAIGAALPPFVASRIMCRVLVSTMTDYFSLVPPSALPASRSWPSTTHARMKPSHALSPPSPQPSRRTCLPSLMRPCPHANFCGATCALAPRTPYATIPLPPGGDDDDEHFLAGAQAHVRSRASAPPALTRAFRRVFFRCM